MSNTKTSIDPSISLIVNPLGKHANYDPKVFFSKEKILGLINLSEADFEEHLPILVSSKTHESYLKPVKGGYTLTVRGVALVLDNENKTKTHFPNVTSLWIGENYSSLMRAISGALTKACPNSVTLDLIDHLTLDFLENLQTRNALHPYISIGRKIYPSIIANWAKKYSYSQFRNWGQDASLRSSRNAITITEFKKNKEEKDDPLGVVLVGGSPVSRLSPTKEDGTPFVWKRGEDGIEQEFYGGDLRKETENSFFLNQTMGRIESIIKHHFPEDTDVYIKTWNEMFEVGPKPTQIAKNFNEEVPKVKERIRRIRSLLKRRFEFITEKENCL